MNNTKCWMCSEEIFYDGEKYRDVTCPSCKVLNSVYNPDDLVVDNINIIKVKESSFLLKRKERNMCGKLADRAKEKSPFISLEIGEESKPLVYKSYKEATDNFGNETFRYFFELETESGFVSKQLDNRTTAFALLMDEIPFGTKVILRREQKIDHAGEAVENKSVWTVKKIE